MSKNEPIPNEWFMRSAIATGLADAEQRGMLTLHHRPAAEVADVIAGHVDRQPWVTEHKPKSWALAFGWLCTVLIGCAALLGLVWLVVTLVRAIA